MTQKKTTTKRKSTTTLTAAQKKKAAELVAGVSVLHDEALELAESVLFMADKLQESRKAMAKEPLVIDYDNGGGQKGIRENPHYVAFEHLMATYNKSLKQLTEIIKAGSSVKKASNVMAELTTIAGKRIG